MSDIFKSKMLHVSRHVYSFSFMFNLNKILQDTIMCGDAWMCECVLLQLQPNIYIIICCDIANIMCCANKNDYVIMYMWTCGD